jgi:hypothetical protein
MGAAPRSVPMTARLVSTDFLVNASVSPVHSPAGGSRDWSILRFADPPIRTCPGMTGAAGSDSPWQSVDIDDHAAVLIERLRGQIAMKTINPSPLCRQKGPDFPAQGLTATGCRQ